MLIGKQGCGTVRHAARYSACLQCLHRGVSGSCTGPCPDDRFDLGGVKLSFGPEKNQGSDQVYFTILQADGSFKPVAKLVKIAGQ